ncbi:MAG: hypothetical protein IPK16_04835 [Anaerolineales bacterium]|nr:hypothetical protein [Anaerolineales bacterium]
MVYVQQLHGEALAVPLAVMGTTSALKVYLPAIDAFVVAEMQLSESPTFSGATWQPYSAFKAWPPGGEDGVKSIYARFRDGAGNVSDAVDASYLLDRMPPMGGIALDHVVAGTSQRTTTLYLGAEMIQAGSPPCGLVSAPISLMRFGNRTWRRSRGPSSERW